jgi:RNA polymerase sigma-70 factor (ECF subfamily)
MTVTEFNSKYETIENLLIGFAMKLTKNRNRANDLMQETVMRAYKNRDRFRDGTNFKAWVTTIMRNSFINDYRKQKTRNRVEQPVEDVINLASSAIKKEEASSNIMMEELNTIVDSLSDTYRVPFMMFYEGFSYLEIAEKMNLPIGTVKSRIFFARKQLKAKVEARYGNNVLETI